MEVSAIIMGQRVRAARQAKKMKTEELAEKVNIAVESIGHIECGARKPSLTLLFNIAEVLEVSLVYIRRRNYAAQYGFKCGLFGAFRQFFGCSNAKDGGFQDLVADDLLTQPKMQRHHENFANIELCNQFDRSIMDALSEENKQHMVSIACAWQQRVYSAAFDGFYCGYRASYDLMEDLMPLVKVENMDKILTMEYYMGYIKPFSEVERLRDMAA